MRFSRRNIHIHICKYAYIMLIHLTLYSFGNWESFKWQTERLREDLIPPILSSDYLQTESYSRIDTVKFIIFSNA